MWFFFWEGVFMFIIALPYPLFNATQRAILAAGGETQNARNADLRLKGKSKNEV